jgi:hypothetical protein
VVFEPKPVQRPYPPLWFGGRSMASLRRAAREGDGWAPAGGALGAGPWLEQPEQLPGWLAQVHETRLRAGNDRPFDVLLPVVQSRIGPGHTVLPPSFVPQGTQQVIDEVGRVGELGATWTSLPLPSTAEGSLEGYLESLHWAAEEVFPAFR